MKHLIITICFLVLIVGCQPPEQKTYTYILNDELIAEWKSPQQIQPLWAYPTYPTPRPYYNPSLSATSDFLDIMYGPAYSRPPTYYNPPMFYPSQPDNFWQEQYYMQESMKNTRKLYEYKPRPMPKFGDGWDY